MKKVFFILLIMLTICHVEAYENKYFEIDLPTDFKIEEEKNNTYKWVSTKNNHENVVITINNNSSTNKHNIEYYKESDLVEYKKYIEEGMNNKLKDYNLTVEVKDVKKEKINNNYSISYNIFWPTKESISYDIYQKGYSFTTNDYIYVYTFTSDKPINNDNANYTKTINSFKLLDSPIKSNGFFDSEWKKILFTSITFGVLGAIISLIKKSRKQ